MKNVTPCSACKIDEESDSRRITIPIHESNYDLCFDCFEDAKLVLLDFIQSKREYQQKREAEGF